ncbi:MAG: D-2-hydroxyacid dehydrogenase [Pseudomonadota bacterium]
MTRVLVVSQHADAYRQCLETKPLVGATVAFAKNTADAVPEAPDAEVLFGAPDLLAPLLAKCTGLRWLQSSWAGVTPLIRADKRDYVLTGVKGIFGQAMGEYVLGWLLALERNIPQHYQARDWLPITGESLAGKRLGILGTGSIGKAVAAYANAFGITVSGLNSDGRAVEGFATCVASGDKYRFANGLDYLLSLLPDTAATDGFVDEAMLAALSAGAIFINAGRGNVVSVEALTRGLGTGQLRHAVLDVFAEEPLPQGNALWTTPGISITSHTAAPTPVRAIVDVFRSNYERYRSGEALDYRIDFEKGY